MSRPYVYGSVAAREAFIKTGRCDSRFAKAFVEGVHRFKTDKSLALATIEKYTKSKTTAESEQVYEIYAQRYTKRAPEVTTEGMQTILEEIGDSRRFRPASRRSALSIRGLSRSFWERLRRCTLSRSLRLRAERARIINGELVEVNALLDLIVRRRRLVRGCFIDFENRVGHRLIAGF